MEENPDDPNDTRRVRRDASPEQIKDAYVGMVSLHSDKDGGNLNQADEGKKAVTGAARIFKNSEKGAKHDLTVGNVAGACHGSEQASPLRGQMLTGLENDEAQSEAVIFAAPEVATAEIPASPDVAVGNGATGPVEVGPNVEIESQTSVDDEVDRFFAAYSGEAENVASAVNNSLSQEVLAAGNSAVPEIEPATRINDDASAKPPAHSVHKNVKRLWKAALRNKDRDELLRLFKEDNSNLKFENALRGRTALHIAAMGVDPENLELAKLILDHLLEERQRIYFDDVIPGDWGSGFWSLGAFRKSSYYVETLARESGKSAMELARENSKMSRNSKAICEKIIDFRRRSKVLVGIERAVELQEKLAEQLCHILKKEESDPEFAEHKKLLGQLIASRNCRLLLEYFERKPSPDIWKYKDESGRTVLHVAAMQGCFPLARQLLDLARDKNDREYIEAVDGLSNLTALQMADDIIGNRSIAEYIKFTLERMKNKDYEHPCFFEAYPCTRWLTALSTGDCNLLEQLLGGNPRLLLETYKGLTVLHVAIICEALNLLQAVLDLFDSNEREFMYGEPSSCPSKLTWKQMLTKKARIDESVFRECVQSKDRYGNPLESQKFISALKDRMQGQNPFDCSAKELVDFIQKLGFRESISNIKIKLEHFEHDKTARGPGWTISRLTELGKTRMEKWKKEWDRGYMADVDFNFEQEPRLTWLRMHYACKYPLLFKEFRPHLAVSTIRDFPSFDGQGRSTLHILLDHSNNEDHFPGRYALNKVVPTSPYLIRSFKDARGRTINDILLMKNYFQHNILLKNTTVLEYDFQQMKFGLGKTKTEHINYCNGMRMDDEHELDDEDEVDDKDEINSFDCGLMNDDAYAKSLMLYLVAKFFKQRNVVQQIWVEVLQKDMEKLKMMLLQIKPIFFIAASIADEKILRLVLEQSDDCTIVDKHGRTALHHAADATLIEFKTLLDCPWIGYCFSTVEDFCKAQRKWSVEREQMTAMFPQTYLEKQSDTEKMKNVERRACILMLLQAGVDLTQEDNYKKIPDIGPTNDTEYRIWWYNTVVKDTMDKKSGFNQAASALSVVGTLVAATSYIGPLQPPMTYDGNGYVRLGEKLVEVFMVSNTLAFYLAMTSVMFAVVPALPMPRESVFSELKRAQHTVAFSLVLLLLSTVFIIVSFAVASMVVIQNHESFNGAGLLTFPSIIGWMFCLIGSISFLIRMTRLMFYDNATIRWIYQFSFIDTMQACYARMFYKRNRGG